ncbi:hypothetical protein [Pseudomonas phage Persinger]|uniref:Uncharacterized protein n=1 Tax=Pseudomonas phage Persinger TaxID=2749430 RepID=A0A7D7ESS2_9CAUD|nr:hypothetical protein KB682_gp32 [Pseudomonas phage Persinger]QMP19198.1 hypothetical protein [Pseudomonas phage Persinger]
MKMTIEIVVTFCKAYFDSARPADRVNDMLICGALVVGQAEGHPLNASKVSEWTTMARPTVIRRLAVLEKKGFVQRHGNVFRVSDDRVNAGAIEEAGKAARGLILNAAAQLSKLDTKGVARR